MTPLEPSTTGHRLLQTTSAHWHYARSTLRGVERMDKATYGELKMALSAGDARKCSLIVAALMVEMHEQEEEADRIHEEIVNELGADGML